MTDKEYLTKLGELKDLIVKAAELAKEIEELEDYTEDILIIWQYLRLALKWTLSVQKELKEENING